MSCQNRDDLEFVIWRQAQEIERLKGENAWMRKNVTSVIEKDNELINENKKLRSQIEQFEKARNIDGSLATYPEAFTKSELWKRTQTENNRILDVIFKRDADKTVRLSIAEAASYIDRELANAKN